MINYFTKIYKKRNLVKFFYISAFVESMQFPQQSKGKIMKNGKGLPEKDVIEKDREKEDEIGIDK